MKCYTGIGSIFTPCDIQDVVFKLAKKLAKQGVILRTGGGAGADWAFTKGCNSAKGTKEIYWPYQASQEALSLALRFNSEDMSTQVYLASELAVRGLYIAGKELNQPSTCLICWTPDGCTSHFTRSSETGRTGTAISIACYFKIPVYNLQQKDHLNQWIKWLEK